MENKITYWDIFWRDRYRIWGLWFVVMWIGIIIFGDGIMFLLNKYSLLIGVSLVIFGLFIAILSIIEIDRRWRRFKEKHKALIDF